MEKKQKGVHNRKEGFPSVSFVIPTLNSENTIRSCLDSVFSQDYEGDFEVIISDGGSQDKTLSIVREFGCRIVENPLHTGEAGKARGIIEAKGEIIGFVDSDNILPDENWLEKMVMPFSDPSVVGSEPLFYEHRKKDAVLTRYCALLGMNDPLCYFIGNYDRICLLSENWNGLGIIGKDKGNYLEVDLEPGKIPTMGANGFFVRKESLESIDIGERFFDIDVVCGLVASGLNRFAKVRVGIVHLYGKGLITFSKKQLRRVRDYYFHRESGARRYPWQSMGMRGISRFIVYTVLIFPIVFQAVRGYLKKPDIAWFFHIPACIATLFTYSYGTVEHFFRKKEQSRARWKQM
ncbi:MAG: glycosyltransferase family 2 protein [Actinomycetota bacterium]|nr:glycosyltransferase family 2 protein [Actinomycetota bacterium]